MSSADFLNSFLKHVDELRSRVLKSLGVFIAASLVCFYYANQVLAFIIKPAGHLVFMTPGGGFQAIMTVTIVMSLVVSSPFTVYQLWSFIAAGLRPSERRFVYIFGPLSLIFFFLGVAFAYWVAIPLAYKFLMGFTSENLTPMITVDNYLGFVANMVIAFGVTFEMPLMMAFFAKVGIASPEFLRQKRRHAIVIILVLAAFLTPPDIASQLLLAVPLMFLYELGIVFANYFYKPYQHKTL